MIRNLYRILFLLCCLGLPVQGKGILPTPPVAPAKTETSTCTHSAAIADKETSQKILATTPTRGTGSLARASSTSSRNLRHTQAGGRLARLTAYWAGEGDYYTGHGLSSTGIRLHDGHCAVDPRIIPYGSVVTIPGVGKYLAVDTGSAVISREAAREAGHSPEERSALVIDIYFESRRDGEQFEANATKYASITWQAPDEANSMTSDLKNMVAESDWNKLRNKQL